MSRIFEAIKHAQLVREGKAPSKSPAPDAAEIPDRRRSRRWTTDIAVYVYGHGPDREPFHEEAHTLNVSAGGALLLLGRPIRNGQKLLLTNRLTQQEQDCRVVYLGTWRGQTTKAGIEFPEAHPEFWPVPAPPKHPPAI